MPLRPLARNLALKAASSLRLNELALALQRRASSRIVVVEMHETPTADQLRLQLDWVAEHFAIITPELVARALETRTRTWPGSKPAVLFTFDDGRESNYRIAAPLLESVNARGIFFVVPEFIGLLGDAAKDYYYSKIDIRNVHCVAANPRRIPTCQYAGRRNLEADDASPTRRSGSPRALGRKPHVLAYSSCRNCRS